MLGNIALICAAAVGSLAILEVFLSESQQARISAGAVALWSALDDFRRIPLASWLRSKAFIYTTMSITTLFVTLYLILLWTVFDVSIDTRIVGTLFCFPVVRWPKLLKELLVEHSAVRLVAILILTSLFVTVCAFLTTSLVIGIADSPIRHETHRHTGLALFLSLFQFSIGILVAATSVFAAGLLAQFVRGLELLVRRIASYPKGPLLALSAILGGIGGILKYFAA